jgi:predicted O-methyltransferase YrrM
MFNGTIRKARLTLRRTLGIIPARGVELAMEVDGQVSRKECELLMRLAGAVPAGLEVVEIGTYRGRSAIALGLGVCTGNMNRVFAIDPHTEWVGPLGGHFGPADQAELYSNLTRARLGKIVAVVCLPSARVARSWEGAGVGLLWIDGDHSYEGVKRDFEAWRPHVAESGVIAFHDADSEGVARFLREAAGEGSLERLGQLERVEWFRKRDHA